MPSVAMVLPGDGRGHPNMAYFLMSGRATLIQHMVLVPKLSSTGLVKYRCLPPGKRWSAPWQGPWPRDEEWCTNCARKIDKRGG